MLKRILSIFLAIVLVTSCLCVTASAASDDIHSFVYLDFENPQALQAGQSYKYFTVHGDQQITTNVIYMLCSRNTNISPAGYENGSFSYSFDLMWQNGSICCYKITSNTAYAFRGDFDLLLLNTASNGVFNWGAFNVYQIFYSGTSGIVKLDAKGLTGSCGDVSQPGTVYDSFNITSFPYVYSVPDIYSSGTNYYLDIKIPADKFIGFDQGSFIAYSDPDHGYFLDGVTVLYNGAPIPFEVTNDWFGEPPASYRDENYVNSEKLSGSGGYVTAVFDIPEQVSSDSYFIVRFIWNSGNDPLYVLYDIEFQSLYGRFSFTKTEYQLLSDIYNILASLDFDTSDIVSAIDQLKGQLDNDLSGIMNGINDSNTLLESIKNNIINFRTQVINGFANVGNWFVDLGDNFSAAIAEWGQKIVDAFVNTDKDAADDFVDKSEQQSSDLSDSVDKIDDIVKPDLDDIINPTVPPVDPDDPSDPTDPNAPTEDPASKPVEVLDPETVGSFAGVFGVFFENGMFSSIFSFVLLMMLASYVLFGKK